MTTRVVFPKPEPVRPLGWEPPESGKDKLFRKLKQQPLVPVGSLLTGIALIVASYHLRKGNNNAFNRSLRWRIYFQGLTAAAAVGGIWYFDRGGKSKLQPDAPADPQAIVEEQNKKAWEERMREAQRKEAEEEQQRKLDAALLRGTGVVPPDGQSGERKRRPMPILGQDGTKRGQQKGEKKGEQ